MSHPKPPVQSLSWLSLINMSVGFFGIQFGWGLQMANMSAIYQFLGASESEIPLLWLAAPVTGLLVQPVIGYYSDRTWTRLGRRRPYFLVGAILASLALVAMPNSPTLWMAAGLLWVLDASVNISMEPFRAFVGDLLPPQQRKVGFAMQSVFIGAGAVLSSSLLDLLARLGVNEGVGAGRIPHTVHIAFYVGAAVFISAVLWTVVTTREHPPADLEAFRKTRDESSGPTHALREIVSGIFQMPQVMRRLAIVQFFTWLGLFCLWIYFTPAIARAIFHAEPGSPEYLEAVKTGGRCFSIYNGVAFGFAFVLLGLTRVFSARAIHVVCLVFGGLGLATVGLWTSASGLYVSMVGVGIAWASILSMPYAMLSNALPPERMGFFMGVFNFFIVLPQIVAATMLGKVVEGAFGGSALPAVVAGGVAMLVAATATLAVPAQEEIR
jgi:maltose/moltooligosaccharide transporter